MKVNVKNMKNINLIIEMSDIVSKGKIKQVKTWMADTKTLLPDYIENMVAKAERDLKVGFLNIYEFTATYYSSFEMPVITIIGKGYDRRPGSDSGILFIEAFTDDSECSTTENRYTQAC